MLRYRPIAPKPATDGLVSGDSTPANKAESATRKRAKRKYVRVKNNTRSRRCMKNKAKEPEEEDWSDGTVATLQLQPEITISQQDSPEKGSLQQLPSLSGKKEMISLKTSDDSDRTTVMLPPPRRVVESWLTLECVTDTCEDEGTLRCTDRDRIKNLEMDTCPGFISNGVDRVQWVNQAYRRMVDLEDGEGHPPEMVVWLGVKEKEKEKFPVQCPAFACRVRVVYTFGKEKHSQTVPCDVWRMEFGGFAWRLDVQAALSLGR